MAEPIKLNVGGKKFSTTRETLTRQKETFFTSLLSDKFPLITDKDGYIFIDRCGRHFHHILNFLRDSTISLEDNFTKKTAKQLLVEATYYQITNLINVLNEYISEFQLTYIAIESEKYPITLINELLNNNFHIYKYSVSAKNYDIYIMRSFRPTKEWHKSKEKYNNHQIENIDLKGTLTAVTYNRISEEND